MLYFNDWLRLFRRGLPAAGRTRPTSLVLERLEDRLVPSSSAGAAFAVPQVVLLPSSSATPAAAAANAPYSPAQIRQAYGFNTISFNNGTVTGDGSGQTIAIIDAYDDPNIASDLHAFDVRFGLSDPTLTVAKQTLNGQTTQPDPTGGWELEEALDVEWAHAMAPGAKILLVEASDASTTNLFSAVQWAASQPGVSVVSMSWGMPEFSSETSLDSVFTTPAGHPGVTFVAATGDQGTNSYPAASPRVLAVGGTTLTLDTSGNYLSETGWNGSGGGISPFESEPAYQNNVQNSGMRTSPDVSYDASPSTSYFVYDTFGSSSNSWVAVGGTSAGAPQWAAIVAIANQGRALEGLGTLDGPGQMLPMLYGMPNSAFHDVTSGSNAGASAGSGYDLVTGRGSPYANRVVAAFAQQVSPSSIGASPGSLPQPTGTPPPASQPPSSSPPPSSQPPSSPPPATPPSPADQIAADALFIAQGLQSNNRSLIMLGLLDFESLYWSSSAAIQPQLRADLFNDLVADLF